MCVCFLDGEKLTSASALSFRRCYVCRFLYEENVRYSGCPPLRGISCIRSSVCWCCHSTSTLCFLGSTSHFSVSSVCGFQRFLGSYGVFVCGEILPWGIAGTTTFTNNTHTHTHDDTATDSSNSIEKHTWNVRCRDVSTACSNSGVFDPFAQQANPERGATLCMQ